MRYFIDIPAHLLPASTPRHLIEYFRETSTVGKHLSLSAYMGYFARTFADFSDGLMLRTDSPDHLVVDLIACGWLYII